jgi:hypothetical protein
VKPEVVARTASGTLRPWRKLHENAPDLHVICQSPRLRLPRSAASRVGRLRRYPQRVAANPPLGIKPAPAKPKVAAKKPAKFTTAAKTAKPSDQPVKQTEKSEEKPASANPPKPETPPALPSDTSEAVRQKAKTKIAASIEEPASAEFHDMKRALRKKTFGQPIDTICGHVKGKKKTGENTGELPFLYIVKEDTAYVVVDGSSESVAAVAYRTICNSPDARSTGDKARE